MFRDLPLAQIHPAAVLAAHVGNCAAEQGDFWPMYERLFEGARAGEWSSGRGTDLQVMLGYARAQGLDDVALRSCVETNRYAKRIETDVREAAARGLQSTPAFVINGKTLIGAQPFESFQRIFDDILAGQ